MAPMIIPRDEWDALELVAEAYGGIGRGSWLWASECGTFPVCLIGAAWFARLPGFDFYEPGLYNSWHGLKVTELDVAQHRVADRLAGTHSDASSRVPFRDLMAELGAVRGDA